jgi:hypothetical protein
MPDGETTRWDLRRIPNANLVAHVLETILQDDGTTLSFTQQGHAYMAVCRVTGFAHARPDDKLVRDIRHAYKIRGRCWHELVPSLYDEGHPGAYAMIRALVGASLPDEVTRSAAVLAALLIVRPAAVDTFVQSLAWQDQAFDFD